MFDRREFLKLTAALVAPLVLKPVRIFVPPRTPYVSMERKGLDALVSHLGVLPCSKELSICEGRVEKIGDWDGTGYPCYVRNVCSFGPPQLAWIYDFDLWNFRHDDEFFPMCQPSDYDGLPNHHAWHAKRRFGSEFEEVIRSGGGFLCRQMFGLPQRRT